MQTISFLKHFVPPAIREPSERLVGRCVYYPEFDRKKCIFIHIPKTAGTSIGQTLFGNGETGHWKAQAYEWTNKKKFDTYYKFAFVRNPWDRLVSAYFYLIQGGKNASDMKWAKENLNQYSSFEDFVLNWLSPESVLTWGHFAPQHLFLKNKAGSIEIDFIGRFEHINRDFRQICDALKLQAQLPKSNSSKRDHYHSYYSEEMKNKVATVYEKDIEHFDYDF